MLFIKINLQKKRKSRRERGVPANVVGLARRLQLQAVGLLLLFVGADGHDGLAPALRARRLVAERARAVQHAVAVLGRNLREADATLAARGSLHSGRSLFSFWSFFPFLSMKSEFPSMFRRVSIPRGGYCSACPVYYNAN